MTTNEQRLLADLKATKPITKASCRHLARGLKMLELARDELKKADYRGIQAANLADDAIRDLYRQGQ